jgi:hypothetical protein
MGKMYSMGITRKVWKKNVGFGKSEILFEVGALFFAYIL